MTELLDTPDISREERQVENTAKRVIGRLYEMNSTGYSLDHARSESPGVFDEQIIDQRVHRALYNTYAASTERNEIKSVQKQLAYDFLTSIEDNSKDVSTNDFILLHDVFETIAGTTDFLQSYEPEEVRSANQFINRYIAATREFVLANPSGGDLLAADAENSRNAFRIYLAAESAIAGDFETARNMLLDVDGSASSPLETVLITRLDDAELESRTAHQKISPEASANNMQHLGVRASQEALDEINKTADPHITIGTTMDTLEDMLSPGGRYMTTGEIHIKSGANDIASSSKKRRGKADPRYNELRSRVETALGHSTNPFLPKIIYGALTSDMQGYRGSGYGPVTLHLKPEVTSSPDTTFTYGDSLAKTTGIAAEVRSIQLNAEDALAAHAYNVEVAARPNNYIEAHVPGVDFEKISKVSIEATSKRGGELQPVISATESCLARGIKAEVIIDTLGWYISDRVRDRISSGMTEDEAVALTVQRIRSNFNQHQDSPLLSLSFVFLERRDLPEDHPGYISKAHRNLFAKHGIIIREPKADGRFWS